MFECLVAGEGHLRWLALKGRVDALSSAEIQRVLEDLILEGDRTILVDFGEVNYVSSAGLRLFLLVQKRLRAVGGEIVLSGLAPSVLEVFRISGLDQLFRVVSTRDEFISSGREEAALSEIIATEVGEIAIKYMRLNREKGSLFVIGTQEPLGRAGYTEKDVINVNSADMQFGCGLGALGEAYEDYKDLFGESMIIHRNFFFYPAVKRSQVDFMTAPQGEGRLTYRFLHGFGFNGSYQYVLSFESGDGFVDLSSLINALFELCRGNIVGISFLAESKGIWGMNLKKVPLTEKKPGNGKGIFDPENFSDWIDFPVEPSDTNHIVAGTGIAVRDRRYIRPEIQALLTKGNAFHIHAGVFETGPLSKLINDYEKELTRVLTELEVYKVQHLLGRSRFGSGMVGMIELEGS